MNKVTCDYIRQTVRSLEPLYISEDDIFIRTGYGEITSILSGLKTSRFSTFNGKKPYSLRINIYDRSLHYTGIRYINDPTYMLCSHAHSRIHYRFDDYRDERVVKCAHKIYEEKLMIGFWKFDLIIRY